MTAQSIDFCPGTGAANLPAVLGLLPPGRAWDAASVAGTGQNRFWSGIATLVGQIVTDLCAFRAELFCSTAVTTRDQWAIEYGLLNPMDSWTEPSLLCTRIEIKGGSTCADLQRVMAAAGYVISCGTPQAKWNASLPIVGCNAPGNIRLAPKAVPILATNCGFLCEYGRAVEHPFPREWQADFVQSGQTCNRPGSFLGRVGCCTRAGQFGIEPSPIPYNASDGCSGGGKVFRYRRPVSVPFEHGRCSHTDYSGKFLRYRGYSSLMTAIYDVPATALLRAGMGLPAAVNPAAVLALTLTLKPAHLRLSFPFTGGAVAPLSNGFILREDYSYLLREDGSRFPQEVNT